MTVSRETITGLHGIAEHVPPVDASLPAWRTTVVQWLITAPGYHPAWNQYVLFVVRLIDDPDFPPAHKRLIDATHELDILALNPEAGHYDVARLQSHEPTGDIPYLTPLSVSVQVEATDDELDQMAWYGAQAIVRGHMSPEPPFSTQAHWDDWTVAMVKTLAHIRGEDHAR